MADCVARTTHPQERLEHAATPPRRRHQRRLYAGLWTPTYHKKKRVVVFQKTRLFDCGGVLYITKYLRKCYCCSLHCGRPYKYTVSSCRSHNSSSTTKERGTKNNVRTGRTPRLTRTHWTPLNCSGHGAEQVLANWEEFGRSHVPPKTAYFKLGGVGTEPRATENSIF